MTNLRIKNKKKVCTSKEEGAVGIIFNDNFLSLAQIYQNYLAKVRKCGERTGSIPVTRVCKRVLPGLMIQHGKNHTFCAVKKLRLLETWTA